jgi:tripartite-type tricarboxylate transporter receptor subunit TctC
MQRLFFALTFCVLSAAGAVAQTYPAHPITLIVPFAAGGTSDVIARVVAERMGQALGQRLVIENVPGAGGSTALTRAARASADGYTLVIGNIGTNAAAYVLYQDLKYTPDAFASIGLAAKTVGVLAIKKDFPAKNLAEFVAYAKANPGKVTLGHAGIGSSNFLICKAFISAAKVDVTLVSYRGAAPALTDLIGGQIDGVCDGAASVTGAIQGGQVRGVAVPVSTRLPSLPDVPTATEAGLPEFAAQGWNAFFAPAETPEPVLVKLVAALKAAVADPVLQKRLLELGAVAASDEEVTPAHLRGLVLADIEKFKTLLAGVKP